MSTTNCLESFFALPEASALTNRDDEYVWGIVKSEKELEQVVTAFTRCFPQSFARRSDDKSKRQKRERRLVWFGNNEHGMGDILIPGLTGKISTDLCSRGGQSRSMAETKPNTDHIYTNMQSQTAQSIQECSLSRKIGCKAVITVKNIILFKSFQMHCDSSVRKKSERMAKVKAALTSGEQCEQCSVFKVTLPLPACHNHPVTVENGLSNRLNPKVKAKLVKWILQGNTSVLLLHKKIRQYVDLELCIEDSVKPADSDRGYYPGKKSIRNLVRRTLDTRQRSDVDQDVLETLATVEVEDTQSTVKDAESGILPLNDNAAANLSLSMDCECETNVEMLWQPSFRTLSPRADVSSSETPAGSQSISLSINEQDSAPNFVCLVPARKRKATTENSTLALNSLQDAAGTLQETMDKRTETKPKTKHQLYCDDLASQFEELNQVNQFKLRRYIDAKLFELQMDQAAE